MPENTITTILQMIAFRYPTLSWHCSFTRVDVSEVLKRILEALYGIYKHASWGRFWQQKLGHSPWKIIKALFRCKYSVWCFMSIYLISPKRIIQQSANFIQKYRGVCQSRLVSSGVECNIYLPGKIRLQIWVGLEPRNNPMCKGNCRKCVQVKVA